MDMECTAEGLPGLSDTNLEAGEVMIQVVASLGNR